MFMAEPRRRESEQQSGDRDANRKRGEKEKGPLYKSVKFHAKPQTSAVMTMLAKPLQNAERIGAREGGSPIR